MKTLYVSAAVLAFTASAAIADGMPRGGSVKDAPAAPVCGTSTYNWSGGFAGINIGSANFRSAVAVEDILGLSTQREESGLTIGGVVGYNWQRCNTVFGIEADLAWTDIERTWGINLGGLGFGGGPLFNAKSEMDLYGSIKVRSGLAFDNMLLYLTGGLAFANIEHKGANTGIGGLPPGAISFNSSDTRWGWVVGAGTEYALTNRITWRSEATYTHFEDKDFSLNISPLLIGPNAGIKLNAQDEVWMIRTGLNYKF